MNESQYKKKLEHFLKINNDLYSEILKLREENNILIDYLKYEMLINYNLKQRNYEQ